MTSKEFVKSKMPDARAERHKTNGNRVYWLIRNGRSYMPFSEGDTESLAWIDAKYKLIKNSTPGDK